MVGKARLAGFLKAFSHAGERLFCFWGEKAGKIASASAEWILILSEEYWLRWKC